MVASSPLIWVDGVGWAGSAWWVERTTFILIFNLCIGELIMSRTSRPVIDWVLSAEERQRRRDGTWQEEGGRKGKRAVKAIHPSSIHQRAGLGSLALSLLCCSALSFSLIHSISSPTLHLLFITKPSLRALVVGLYNTLVDRGTEFLLVNICRNNNKKIKKPKA